MIRDPRDPGLGSAPFEVPDEIWNDEARRPSWVRLVNATAAAVADEPAAADPEPVKSKRKAKAETATAEPFAEAPVPQSVEINSALGQTEPKPDWVAPAGSDI